jgi:hypothetical protein
MVAKVVQQFKRWRADKAGLKDMDVILSVNSVPVTLENPYIKLLETIILGTWRRFSVEKWKDFGVQANS